VRSALAITKNTIREVLRERVVVVLALFGIAMAVGAQALAPLALGEGRKIVVDFGLAGSSILATILAVVLGSTLLHKEMERRTLYAVLAKPIRREAFLLGKFLGLWGTSGLLLAGMTGIVIATVTVFYAATPWGAVPSLLLTLTEIGIVTALVTLFSSFTTPALTAFFALAMVTAGHFAEDLRYFAQHGAPPFVSGVTDAAYWLLPHLELFNARGVVAHGLPVDPARLWFATAYGLLYMIGVLILAGAVFRRKEFR
jgi:Cu-processing system permease protein